MSEIKFPFGSAEVIELTASGDQNLAINDALSVIDGVAVPATGNRTINLVIGDFCPIGAQIFVQSKSAATETLTFGTGITGAVLTGVTGKTFGVLFVYNGTAFIEASTPVQID